MMFRITPCAIGERTKATSSMPASRMLATYSPCPRRKRRSSLRGRLAPTPFELTLRLCCLRYGRKDRSVRVEARAGPQAEIRAQHAVGLLPRLLVVHQRPAAAVVVEHRHVGFRAGAQRA